jgi:hypothetical protein
MFVLVTSNDPTLASLQRILSSNDNVGSASGGSLCCG